MPIPETLCGICAPLKSVVFSDLIGEKSVVKYIYGFHGHNVFLMPSKSLLLDISESLNQEKPYLLQEYVKNSHGVSLRVEVIDNEVHHVYKIRNIKNKMQSNYDDNDCDYHEVSGKFPEAETMALKAVKAVGVDIAGVDLLFLNDNKFVICEINIDPDLVWDKNNKEYDDLTVQKIADMISKRLNRII